MSTSDQDGNRQLTRKQLRELRLTGSTPVISEEEAANAAQPVPVLPRAAEPIVVEPAPEPVEDTVPGAPLTRRQARERERTRTGSLPVTAENADEHHERDAEPDAERPADASPADVETAAPSAESDEAPQIVSEVPRFDAPAADEASDEAAVVTAPVAVPAPPAAMVRESARFDVEDSASQADAVDAGAVAAEEAETSEGPEHAETHQAETADAHDAEPAETQSIVEESSAEEAPTAGEQEGADRPMVGAAFGLGVKAEESPQTFPPLFDAILEGDSAGSHHTAPSALIFTHTPGVGSLSGPVASTGELLITGTYELPEGLGSRGHALGAADGKDVDAVLIDGELAPASSPTPIAASSAVSTSKPAGEVIRPPAPEKGNKLMLTLAVVAGGLALALATVLIVAFTTNLF